jgi:site-specific DNA-cytosine methylase
MSWISRLSKRGLSPSPIDADSATKKRTLIRRTTPLGDPPLDAITREHFHDGTFLDKFVHRCVHKAIRLMGRPIIKRTMTVGGACDGSAALSICLYAVQQGLESEEVDANICLSFSIEIDPVKRSWCTDVHQVLGHRGCVYDDVSKVNLDGSEGPSCKIHRERCLIRNGCVNGFVSGISCKDLVRENAQHRIASTTASASKSADPMRGILRLIRLKLPDWIILQDVDLIIDGDQGPALDLVLQNLAQCGLDCQTFKIDAQDYALPQHRIRLYIVGVLRPARSFTLPNHADFFGRITDLMNEFKMPSPSLTDVLFCDDDHRVLDELVRRQARGPPSEQWGSSAIQSHRQAWKSLNMRWQTVKASLADQASPWFDTICVRERDMLAFLQASARASSKADPVCSQDARTALSSIGNSINHISRGILNRENQLISPAILPRAKIWVSLSSPNVHASAINGSVNRFLIGEEKMMIQGWPIAGPKFSGIKESRGDRANGLFEDLAGNAFPCTVMSALITAIVFAIDPKVDQPDEIVTDDSDVASALALFASDGA